jgi:DNA-binding MarR family transcriptional regulator
MNAFEKLRRHILNNQKSNPSGSVHYLPITLANELGLEEDHVKQVLNDMEHEGLITQTASGNYIMVKVTAPGAELREGIPTSPIGF